MKKLKLESLTIADTAALIRDGGVTSKELTLQFFDRINKIDPALNSYLLLLKERALESAANADKAIQHNRKLGALHGVPLALKDLFDMKGVRTTSASKIHAKRVATYDATVTGRLERAGAIILGKLNMNEFAFGIDGYNPHYGSVSNPWDTTRIPGGSSSGSAAAVAASLCLGALGTDTGGSIRIPASLCGVVGLKPTYGRVSRYGVTTLSSSQDHVGPLAKSVQDAAILLKVLAGQDSNDPSSSHLPVPDYQKRLGRSKGRFKIGVPPEAYDDTSKGVAKGFANAMEKLADLGSSIVTVKLPYLKYIRTVNLAIMYSEVASYHREYLPERMSEYGQDVRTRIHAGMLLRATDYVKALRIRALLKLELGRILSKVDVIATPTTPITAAKKTEDRLRVRRVVTRWTAIYDVTGLPAISIPCGFDSNRIPIGLQLASAPFSEEKLLGIARLYESNTGWGKRHPNL